MYINSNIKIVNIISIGMKLIILYPYEKVIDNLRKKYQINIFLFRYLNITFHTLIYMDFDEKNVKSLIKNIFFVISFYHLCIFHG